MNADFLLSSPTISYCEQAASGLVARPGYAITNIAFIVVGLILIFKKKKLSISFGILSLLVGIFSFIYDATYTLISQWIDLSGMLIFALYVLGLNLQRLKIVRNKLLFTTCCLAFGISLIVLYGGVVGNVIFGSIILLILATEYIILLNKTSKRGIYLNWIIASSLFVIGLLFWLLDYSKMYCDPMNLFNGRGVFHYLAAGSIWFFYKFYSKL